MISTTCWNVLCYLRTYDEIWNWQLYFGSKFTVVSLFYVSRWPCVWYL